MHPIDKGTQAPASGRNDDRSAPAHRPQERILEEDRKKLEDILKRHN